MLMGMRQIVGLESGDKVGSLDVLFNSVEVNAGGLYRRFVSPPLPLEAKFPSFYCL